MALPPALDPAEFHPVRREARALAGAVDLLVILAMGALCALLALGVMLLQVNPFARDPTGGEWAVGYGVVLSWLPLAALYASFGERTLGARLLRLRLVSRRRDPRFIQRIIRGLLWWPSLLLFGVGLWWAWLDAEGRSLSDLASGTLLVEPCA